MPTSLGGAPAGSPELTGSESCASRSSNPILDLIMKAEGTKRGYNDSFAHQLRGTLTDKTLSEIDGMQGDMIGSSAIGKYQFMRATLRGLRKELGLTGEEKFDANMQDRLAMRLYDRRMKQAARGGGGEDAVLLALAQEWASFPTATGQGYYKGQRASVSAQQVLDAVRAQRGAGTSATKMPPYGTPLTAPPGMGRISADDFNARWGGLGGAPMGASGNSSVSNQTFKLDHSTNVTISGASDPATTANRVKETIDRGTSVSLRNAQSAVR